jgi:hypothetical protein
LRHIDPDLWRDHPPPHFHALYAEDEALIDIRTLEVLEGELPRRALALVLEWAEEHRSEPMEDWELCSRNQSPKKIPPLAQCPPFGRACAGAWPRCAHWMAPGSMSGLSTD